MKVIHDGDRPGFRRAPASGVVALLCALAPAGFAQGGKLPGIPVVLDEILAEMKDPPTKHEAREEALIALFKQAGAAEASIERLPLSAAVQPRLQEARDAALARLKEAGASEAELEGARKVLERRHQDLGRNVRVVLPGRTDRILAFGAHLDAADGSPGVIDDWAACVLLTNLYQTLRSARLNHTVWFVGFAEEELGCIGSKSLADSLEKKVATKIDVFVTLDCIGPSPVTAWWSGSSSGAVEIAVDLAQQAGISLPVVDFPGAASDSLSLKKRSIPVLALFGTDPAHLSLLHGPEDRFEAVEPRRIGEAYALLRTLAAGLDLHAQPLFWDYVKAKLRINDPASGRKPIRPMKLDLAAAPLPTPPDPPTSPPEPRKSPRDGSQP
jgi:hypothetical protein